MHNGPQLMVGVPRGLVQSVSFRLSPQLSALPGMETEWLAKVNNTI